MDYIFTSSILLCALLTYIASYDIACQWLKNFWRRMSADSFPSHLVPQMPTQNLIGKIPKFHFDTHIKKDHAQYSLNFTRGVGCTDGEGIERNWSDLKPGVGQTVEMGPGGRHNTIDDFCGYANYRKMADVGMCTFLSTVDP